MFSRSNHHDQKVPAHGRAPPTLLAPHRPAGDYLQQLDPLSAHYFRLESLLDSALATLTLIRDYAPTTDLPTLTDHMTEVLRALCRLDPLPAPCPATPTTTPMVTPSPSPPPPSKTATYAEAVAAPDPVATPTADADETTPTNPSPHSERVKTHTPTPDLVFRLNSPSYTLPPITSRPHPAQLFFDISGSPILGDLSLTSIRWTSKGNLTLAFHHGQNFTAEEAMNKVPAIWDFVRPLLKLPKHCACPRVDRGEPWHNVVIHGVPTAGDAHRKDSIGSPEEWLQENRIHGTVVGVSVMGGDVGHLTRGATPLRVSLSSKNDADLLVRNGALIYGAWCRVSRYIAKKHQSPHASPHP
ncbi:hypothetical protein DFH08DRAFT_965103 [Mycena albidolilacea]|uniref:Uncharacterized protein n=1 Tax=Mycena albidolilacea TaxID=1033008 RepID=A0AAD6ZSU1_9AGAR|nr:hypothetical protein DFH08DRAFT_965103 [Mycena albidolilacea]